MLARKAPACFTLGLMLAAGCEVQRPVGSYVPEAGVEAGAGMPDLPEQLDNDELPALVADAGASMDAATGLTSEIAGDYWMRADLYTFSESGGIRVNSHGITYSLVRVGTDPADGVLKMIDWQCVATIEQTCDMPCLMLSTTISRGESRAYRPPVRRMKLDAETGKWSVSLMPFALGWRGNFFADPDAGLPQDATDPRVYDVAGDGKGVNVHIDLVTSSTKSDCESRVVQKFGFAYAGILQSDALVSGELTEKGSEQVVFGGSCPPAVRERQTQPYTVRFARMPAGQRIDATWTCPDVTEFRARLPEP